MFLIYNTITFSVVQRRPIFGILRCLGVTRREIFRMVLTEAMLLGAIGGLIGVAFGIVLGRGAVQLVTRTINDLYYVVNVQSIEVSPLTLLKGFVLGIVAAILAALPPAYEATSIQPITALKRSNVEQRVRGVLLPIAAIGVGMGLLGALLLLLSNWLVLNFAGIFGVVIGAALIAPVLTLCLMTAAQPILGRLGGVIGRMAARGIVNSISRTAVAIASLMIAVSVIIGLQSMISSFRQTLVNWLASFISYPLFRILERNDESAVSPWINSLRARPAGVRHARYVDDIGAATATESSAQSCRSPAPNCDPGASP